MLATLYFSLGTPMLLSGDEFGRSQQGNNNAYCQDNEISWVDWQHADARENHALARYVVRLAKLRKNHPTLRFARFMHGKTAVAPELPDIAWFDETGAPMQPGQWEDPERRRLMLRRAAPDERGGIEASRLLLNGASEDCTFKLPETTLDWVLALDSSDPEKAMGQVDGDEILVPSHAVVLLIGKPKPQ